MPARAFVDSDAIAGGTTPLTLDVSKCPRGHFLILMDQDNVNADAVVGLNAREGIC